MNGLEIVLAAVALIWGGVVLYRGGLLGGCLLVMLAAVCFSHPFFTLPAGPVALTADRVLWAVLVVQYLVWRRLGLAQPKPWAKAEIALLAFFGVLVASTFLHDWQARRSQPLVQLVLLYAMPLGMYWIARDTRLSQRGILALFGLAGLLAIYLAVTAWAETRELWWLVYPKYIASSEHQEYLGRGRGPFLNPAACGLYQGVGMAALLMGWPRANRFGRGLLLAGCALVCVGIYSTLTRCAWLGAGLGLVVLLGLTLPGRWRVPLVAAVTISAVLAAATQWERLMSFKRDRSLDAQQAAESARLRPILATVAWHMFLDRPLAGCGFGQYLQESRPYFSDRSTDLPLEKARPFVQHNVLLALLVETGLLGAGLFLSMLLLWARDAWRLCRAAPAPLWARQQALLLLVTMAGYLANGMFQDVAMIPTVNMLLFFMAGLTASLRHLAEPELNWSS